MNIVNKLTIRQLILNRRRTLVTIIGTIISVAMITAVATLGVSFMDLLQRQAIETDGEWHVLYNNVNGAQLHAIVNDAETKEVILSRDTGYALLKDSRNKNKPYLFIKEYNLKGFEKFPIELAEGRFPQRADEIVISEAILTNAKVEWKIGDVITVDIGKRYSDEGNARLTQYESLIADEDEIKEHLTLERTNTYTIVGMIKRPTWEPTWSPGYTALSYVDESAADSEGKVNASVILRNVNNKLFDHAKKLAEANGIEKVAYNDHLLRFYGVVKDDSFKQTLFTLSAIIMVIIVIGSVTLIFNSFAISVAERSRHLGMLSSVGATKKQKRNSVFFEGLLIGCISIPIGILSGFAGIGVTFLWINSAINGALGLTQSFRLVVLPSTILTAVLVSAVTIFISTYIPAKRASNVSAIDAIRQTADVKIKGREVKTSALTRKIFGIEGDLGLKNLKRNKGRYKATVVSLTISMVLFLTVSYFTSSIKKSYTLTQDGINFDIRVTIQGENEQVRKSAIEKVRSLEGMTEYAQVDTLDLVTHVNEAAVADYLKDREIVLEDGGYPYFPVLNVLDDEALKAYAQEAGADFEALKKTDTLSVIVIDTVKYKDQLTGKYVETKSIKTKVGEKLDLQYYDSERDQYAPAGQVKIAALTDKMPMGVMSKGQSSTIDLILSRDAFNKLLESNATLMEQMSNRIYIKAEEPLKLQEELESIQDNTVDCRIYVHNVYMARQSDEQMLLLISVFVYGFVLLITAICAANILNTISTSIALRKREFAMLKSVGMTPRSFNRMINYESIFYGIKALLYGLPLSYAIMYLIHRTLMREFDYRFMFPWTSACITVIAVFAIVGVAMIYSSSKVKKENIIDVLKQEII